MCFFLMHPLLQVFLQTRLGYCVSILEDSQNGKVIGIDQGSHTNDEPFESFFVRSGGSSGSARCLELVLGGF